MILISEVSLFPARAIAVGAIRRLDLPGKPVRVWPGYGIMIEDHILMTRDEYDSLMRGETVPWIEKVRQSATEGTDETEEDSGQEADEEEPPGLVPAASTEIVRSHLPVRMRFRGVAAA